MCCADERLGAHGRGGVGPHPERLCKRGKAGLSIRKQDHYTPARKIRRDVRAQQPVTTSEGGMRRHHPCQHQHPHRLFPKANNEGGQGADIRKSPGPAGRSYLTECLDLLVFESQLPHKTVQNLSDVCRADECLGANGRGGVGPHPERLCNTRVPRS